MGYTASINIDAGKKRPVERRIFGHFIEHLGRCINKGVWDERLLHGDMEFGCVRKDVFEAIKGLRPTVLRWPGGCFSDTYHWRDGAGPESSRKRRINQAWWWVRPPETIFENNHFGTDEFMDL